MMKTDTRVALPLAWLWTALAGVSAAMLVRDRDPSVLVLAGALVALVAPERDPRATWSDFAAAAGLRIGDATIAGAIAWYVADVLGDARGAAVAAAMLALAVVASYVRIRAMALGLTGGALVRGRSFDRAVWLALLALALGEGSRSDTGELVGGVAAAAAWTAILAVARGVRVIRSASRG